MRNPPNGNRRSLQRSGHCCRWSLEWSCRFGKSGSFPKHRRRAPLQPKPSGCRWPCGRDWRRGPPLLRLPGRRLRCVRRAASHRPRRPGPRRSAIRCPWRRGGHSQSRPRRSRSVRSRRAHRSRQLRRCHLVGSHDQMVGAWFRAILSQFPPLVGLPEPDLPIWVRPWPSGFLTLSVRYRSIACAALSPLSPR